MRLWSEQPDRFHRKAFCNCVYISIGNDEFTDHLAQNLMKNFTDHRCKDSRPEISGLPSFSPLVNEDDRRRPPTLPKGGVGEESFGKKRGKEEVSRFQVLWIPSSPGVLPAFFLDNKDLTSLGLIGPILNSSSP